MGLPADRPARSNYQDQHLVVNFQQQKVVLDGQTVTLRRKEFDLLAMLVQAAGEVVPRQSLLHRVWGYNNQVRTRTLDVHVRRLRVKLGLYASRYIETIFGIGYRFQPIGLIQTASPGADSRFAARA